MKVEYEWKVEVVVSQILTPKLGSNKVILRARYKQMHDEWGTWKETDPVTLCERETMTYSFPFTMSLPEGGKL